MSEEGALMARLTTREALLGAVRDLREDLERVVAEAGESRLERPGGFGELTLKDVVAHLTSWRLITAVRLEAGLRGEEPTFPWPAHLSEEHDTDAINRWLWDGTLLHLYLVFCRLTAA